MDRHVDRHVGDRTSTRDGIHGREFISTSVDIGQKPPFLRSIQGVTTGESVRTFSIPIPVFFDVPPASILSRKFLQILVQAAQEAGTLLVLPAKVLSKFAFQENKIVPLLGQEEFTLPKLRFTPRMIELEDGNEELLKEKGSLPRGRDLLALRTCLEGGAIKALSLGGPSVPPGGQLSWPGTERAVRARAHPGGSQNLCRGLVPGRGDAPGKRRDHRRRACSQSHYMRPGCCRP